jgi:hypothetical protein
MMLLHLETGLVEPSKDFLQFRESLGVLKGSGVVVHVSADCYDSWYPVGCPDHGVEADAK